MILVLSVIYLESVPVSTFVWDQRKDISDCFWAIFSHSTSITWACLPWRAHMIRCMNF